MRKSMRLISNISLRFILIDIVISVIGCRKCILTCIGVATKRNYIGFESSLYKVRARCRLLPRVTTQEVRSNVIGKTY